jgi:pimeloyl-ACP methyl ester carboxylesterase
VPVVYVNGGPGSDAIAQIPDLLDAKLNQDRELIVITQRGTVEANPLLSCRTIDRYRAQSLGRRSDGDHNRRQLKHAVKNCRRQLQGEGVRPADYNTTQSALDLVALRRVLGIDQWDVFSHSYGTELTLTYMRRYPKGIRSVVLDGTVPPSVASLGWTWSSFKESSDNIFAACRAQKSCRDRFPHTRRTYVDLVNQTTRRPIKTRVKVPDLGHPKRVVIDGSVLVNWLTRQSHFSPTVPLEIDQLANGDPQPIAKDWADARAVPKQHWGNFAYGVAYGVWCSEWLPFESPRQEMKKAKQAFPGFPDKVLRQAPQLTFMRDICKAWNVPRAAKSIRDVTRGKIPTLALTGTFDAQTGARWGAYAARPLSNSTVVDLPGVSHGAFTNPCGAKVVDSFYKHPNDPNRDCVAHVHPRPFLLQPPGEPGGGGGH